MSDSKKNKLLRNINRKRLRTIAILPSFITIINGIAGFSAIILAGKATSFFQHTGITPSYLSLAGYLVVLAMIADMLDGRVARFSHSTSSFGGQLDSLCDVISFGVAPAYLVYKMLSIYMANMTFTPSIEALLTRLVWLSVIIYMVCTVIRLARFNVENEEDESAHMNFVGLPSPAAAGLLVSLVIFHQEALVHFFTTDDTSNIFNLAIFYSLPFITMGTALLMVSRIIYPHVANQYLRGRKPFYYLIRIVFLLGLLIWSWQTALLVAFWGFALAGLFKTAWARLKIKYFSLDTEQKKSPALTTGD